VAGAVKLRIRRRFLVVLLVPVASACWSDSNDSRSATAGLPALRQDLEANEWVLDRSASSLSVDDDNPITLVIRDDAISGTGPCNTYRGQFDLDDDSVEISDLAFTRRACADSTMEAEDEFFRSLAASDSVEVSDDRLVLRDGGRLVFEKFDVEEAILGPWPIVDVAAGDAIVSVIPGTDPTLTFDNDGNLALTTGCNSGGGSWMLDGDVLTIDRTRLTLKACAEPTGVMEQEASLVSALESSARVEVAPNELIILDDQGSIVLVAAR
jgi:heat shock protein HslJ